MKTLFGGDRWEIQRKYRWACQMKLMIKFISRYMSDHVTCQQKVKIRLALFQPLWKGEKCIDLQDQQCENKNENKLRK